MPKENARIAGRKIFHIDLRLSTKMPPNTPKTPTTPLQTPSNPMALSESKDIFSTGPESPLFPPLPERNVRNRKPSFLFNHISQNELLAPFRAAKRDC
jgi:hypothetical protein